MTQPKKLTKAWAEKGLKNSIPLYREGAGVTSASATYEDGFPETTMKPIYEGGKAPSGKDMNGILHEITAHIVHQNKGNLYQFDAELCKEIDGYSKGSILVNDELTKIFISLIDNNKINFNVEDYVGKWDFLCTTESLRMPDGFKHIGACESIAQLRTIEPTADQQRILIKSYYAGKNLGGGVFYADFGDNETADNSGTVIVTAGGKRWKRLFNKELSFYDFGILENTEQSEKINLAIQCTPENGELIVPKGIWLVNNELKLKSNFSLIGCGSESVIKSVNNAHPEQNTITTENNNRAFHSNYVENITVKDLSIDGNWQNRSQTISAKNQGCCLKFVTTRNFYVKNVTALNAVLHGFDVCASNYFDDGNINHTAEGASEYGSFVNCTAVNPKRDDAFTTHNSGFITFSNCYAEFDRSLYGDNLRNNNHGFEMDEGSYNVQVLNCYAKGFFSGYQVKGHDTTKAAQDILIENSISDYCVLGVQIVHIGISTTSQEQLHTADNVIVRNHRAMNLENAPKVEYPKQFVRISGYWNVRIENLITENSGDAYIAILNEANNIIFDGVEFLSESTLSKGGLIWLYSSNSGEVKLKNIVSKVAQPITIIQKSSVKNTVLIDGVSANGKMNGKGLINVSINKKDIIQNLDNSQNWTSKVLVLNKNDLGLGNDEISCEVKRGIISLKGNATIDSLSGFEGCHFYHESSSIKYIYDAASKKYIPLLRKIDSGLILKKDTQNWNFPPLWFNGFNNSDYHIVTDKGKYLRFGQIDEQTGEVTGTVGISTNGWLVPLVNNQYKLGQANLKWAELNLVTPSAESNGDIGATTKWVRELLNMGSNTQNGWEKMPSGRIMQWGIFNAENGNTFDFPIAFNQVFNVFCTDENAGGDSVVAITVTNKTNTSFSIKSTGNTGRFAMLAIGR